MTQDERKKIIRRAAFDLDLSIMSLTELCTGLSYERVKRVWEGLGTAKISDYDRVLEVLGKKLTVVSTEASCNVKA